MAIVMFSAVNSRRRSLGVLKALGFSQRYLIALVVAEALVLIAISLPLGLLLAGGLAYVIEFVVPVYLLPVAESTPLLRTFIASVSFTVLGALVPVRLIRRLDPSAIFRA